MALHFEAPIDFKNLSQPDTSTEIATTLCLHLDFAARPITTHLYLNFS
jgi:hypothetical protein